MAVHQLTWRATASGVEDEMVLAEALATLIGDEEAVERRDDLTHGPRKCAEAR